MPWFLSIWLKPLGSWLADKLGTEVVSDTYKTFKTSVLTPLHAVAVRPRTRHFRELYEKVNEMPFIYKDLEGGSLQDFVEVDMTALDIKTLESTRPLQQQTPLSSNVQERFRENRLVFLMGKAGIGKTTFLRHSILELISGKGTSKQFFPGEKLVPFYIPLKSLDFTTESPIVEYLLKDNTMLSGADGLARLIKLAHKKEIFLLLDGYDEVPFTIEKEGTTNPVHEELIRMVQPEKWGYTFDGINHQYDSFYSELVNCRIFPNWERN
jgi:hypothetical protein